MPSRRQGLRRGARAPTSPRGRPPPRAAGGGPGGGARARIAAVQADDDAGAIVRRELASRGVDVRGPRGERTGVVVSLVQPDGDRTMASDRGSAPDLPAEAIDAEWLACDALHLSGYSLLGGAITAAAQRAAALAHEQGARVSVDLSSWTH